MATRVGRFLGLVTSVLLLVGCGESVAASQEVSLHVSGGIAGVQRGIEVGPGGAVTLIDREGRHAGRELSGDEREKLGSLLGAVDFAGLPARSIDEGSRDRFEYRLAHAGRTVITDRSTDLGPADDLIDHLESCMEARRAGAVQHTPTRS